MNDRFSSVSSTPTRFDTVLDSRFEEVLSELTQLAAEVCQCSIALVTLVTDDRQIFLSRVGSNVLDAPLDVGFCPIVVQTQTPLVIPDTQADSCDAESAVDVPRIRFYAGIPLIVSDGSAIGTLCVLDQVPHDLSEKQLKALKTLARQVVAQFELRCSAAQVSETKQARIEAVSANINGATVKSDSGLETVLRRHEFFNRQILQYSQDCIQILDLDGHLLYLSPGGQRQLQVEDTTPYLHQSWVQGWRKEDQPIVIGAIAAAKSGGVGEFQGFYATTTGKPKWWDTVITPILGPDQQVQQLLAISRDITERKQAELLLVERDRASRALRESEHRYRTLFESIDEGFCVCELLLDDQGNPQDHRFLEVNSAFESLTGLTQVTGKTARELMPNLEPFWNETYARVLQTGEPVRVEQHSPAFDRWFDVYVFPMSSNSLEHCTAANRLAILFTDITERKRTALNTEFLAKVSRDLLETTAVSEIVQVVGERLHQYLKISSCAFVEINELSTEAIIDHHWHQTTVPSLIGTYDLPRFVSGEFLRTAQAGQPIVVRDVTTDPRVVAPERFAALKIGAELNIPLIRDGNWKFSLTVFHREPYYWRDDEIALMQELAARIWAKLERARTERELQLHRQLLETVVNHTPSSVAIIRGQDLTFQLVNPAYQALAPGKVMVGKTIGEVWTEAQPLFAQRCRHVIETGIPYHANDEAFEIRRAEDEPLNLAYFSWSMHRIELLSNDEWGILVSVWETTDRKQIEEDLRSTNHTLQTLIESSPLPIVVIDPDCVGLLWNPAAERLFGWSAAEILGKPLPIVSDDKLEECERIRAAVTRGETFSGVTTHRRKRDLSLFDVEISAAPIYNSAGKVEKMVVIYQDVSDRVQLERDRWRVADERDRLLQQEQAAREAAEQANRIKDEFLAVLSHELRSPLNPILGWTKMLQSGNLNPTKTAQALNTIERNAKLQTELISDLLDVSRILRGKLSLNMRPVDLKLTVAAAIETVTLAAEAKSIEMRINLDSTMRPVLGDSNRLQQVVWNLVSNAVKFTPERGAVDVRLTRVGHYAQIAVTDTGKGIHPDFLPYVFDCFRQEDGATTRKYGGLGLGLAIVRHLVELHGGQVWADSPGENRGATFTVQIPLSEATLHSIATSEPLRLTDSSPLTGIRILIVDDEADVRDITTFTLEQAGATTRAVANAAAALAVLEPFQPDVLLSDIGMPDIDGYMLLRQIRLRSPNQGGQVPAIALTAYAAEFDQQQALQAGFQRHLAKPVEPDVLTREIVKLLNDRPSR